uniref:terminase small subunit n=1 Tax=Eubacterium sp. TaxID=142586 RepID=UPI00204E52D4|nr:MAG TPA: Terminase small subunit [Caudoviricetes sp.]
MARKLTKKQQLFVDEYLIDLNATQAAIRAGYSVNSARDIGCENLTKPNIQQAIAEHMAERSKRTGVNQDRIVLELAKIAFVNMGDLINLKNGSILTTAKTDDLACIEGFKYKESDNDYGGSVEREVKFASKLRALELLGKHLGMWNDKLDVNITQPIVIMGADQLED